MPTAPALFIGHGSPMNAIEETWFSQTWSALAQRFATPRAILCISAHWVTDGVRVMCNAHPRTIHDFRGFPPELHAVQYSAPGAPEVAERVAALLSEFNATLDSSWGLDHGAWSVLKWLYPAADVPVLQLSLDARRTPGEHYAIGRALRAIRDDNVMVMGTGNIVHNLRAFFSGDASLQDACRKFDDFVLHYALGCNDAPVIDYAKHPIAALAAPDWEHFVPLLYVLGARERTERVDMFNRDVVPGLSMSSLGYSMGIPA